MDRGACWAAVHGVAQSRTQLSDRAHVRAQTLLPLVYFLRYLKIIRSFGFSWLIREEEEAGDRKGWWGQAGRTLLSAVRSPCPGPHSRAGP